MTEPAEPTVTPIMKPLHPSQAEMPFGLMYGKAITKLPDDLYIPPDALEVFLEAFEGPLDLLLYLIKHLSSLKVSRSSFNRSSCLLYILHCLRRCECGSRVQLIILFIKQLLWLYSLHYRFKFCSTCSR